MNLSEIILGSRGKLHPSIWNILNELFWSAFWRREDIRESFQHTQLISGLKFSERGTLIKCVAEDFPFSSLLEAGCGVGQNLTLLSKLVPSVLLTGLDLSSKSLQQAKDELGKTGTSLVTLIESDLNSLGQFPDKSFEIVMVSAVLLYIPGDEIQKVVSELLRITSRKLFLLEQQQPNPQFAAQHLGVFTPRPGQFAGYWQRDYVKLLELFVSSDSITVHKVPNPVWESEKWKSFAKVIVADVSSR